MATRIRGTGIWVLGYGGMGYGDYYFILRIFISVSISLITVLDQCQHHISQYQTIRV